MPIYNNLRVNRHKPLYHAHKYQKLYITKNKLHLVSVDKDSYVRVRIDDWTF